MDLLQAIKERHSVRSYTDRKIDGSVKERLLQTIEQCTCESGLNIQLCLEELKAFSGLMARYGKFKNVRNYIAFVGPKNDELQEKCGYYGEKIVLFAQQLGLNTCWVGLSYSKGKCAAKINDDEKLLMVIALGYGEVQGVPHKTKPVSDLCSVVGNMPEWFIKGIEAVQLAPTALNQQKFMFELIDGNTVKATTSKGFYVKVDLGIAKYHFEIGVGEYNDWKWV